MPSSPVFPSNLIVLKEKGTLPFDMITTTVLLYTPEATGWDPVPIVFARLGLADELAITLDHWPEKWQIYCNGWGHWGPGEEMKKDNELFFRTNTVKDAAVKDGKTFPFPMWPFRHTSMEAMSVLATAMNEALLQSYEGAIRIAPAFPANKFGRFTLHAEGGFIVSGEIKSGAVQWIAIKSTLGDLCRIDVPWNRTSIYSNLRSKPQIAGRDIAKIKTKAGEILIIVPAGVKIDSWSPVSESPEINEKVRLHTSGKAQLGLPRMF